MDYCEIWLRSLVQIIGKEFANAVDASGKSYFNDHNMMVEV
jgi:hypothetical protein